MFLKVFSADSDFLMKHFMFYLRSDYILKGAGLAQAV
jgi:hypothetical protein